MSETSGKPESGKDDAAVMSARISGLIRRYSPMIWDFWLDDNRSKYYVQLEDLVADASDETKKKITDRELHLDGDETDAVDYYRDAGRTAMAQFRLEHMGAVDLGNLEGIYRRNTISFAPGESKVRLGAISIGEASDIVANILVPQHYDKYLNLRNAAGTLERGIVDVAKDHSAMVLKVPGLLAVDTIREYLDDGHPNDLTPPGTGQYL